MVTPGLYGVLIAELPSPMILVLFEMGAIELRAGVQLDDH
jgi:hypothetical protein